MITDEEMKKRISEVLARRRFEFNLDLAMELGIDEEGS